MTDFFSVFIFILDTHSHTYCSDERVHTCVCVAHTFNVFIYSNGGVRLGLSHWPVQLPSINYAKWTAGENIEFSNFVFTPQNSFLLFSVSATKPHKIIKWNNVNHIQQVITFSIVARTRMLCSGQGRRVEDKWFVRTLHTPKPQPNPKKIGSKMPSIVFEIFGWWWRWPFFLYWCHVRH